MQVCAFFYRFAIYHLIMNVDAVAKQQQQFLNVNQRLKSLDPPLEVLEKPVQRRSHWHIGYIENKSKTKGAKVLKSRKNCKTCSIQVYDNLTFAITKMLGTKSSLEKT